SRSAIEWRDIAPGAQTERRGGAGPAGACLAVRTPPAAFHVEAARSVLLQLKNLHPLIQVPNVDDAIRISRCQALAVAGKRQMGSAAGMPAQSEGFFAHFQVPELDGPVDTRRIQTLAVSA